MSAMSLLPIDDILPQLMSSLKDTPNVVLQASPGAGKTTRIPLALLDASWRKGGKIIMLEPRRLATRAAARRMAQTLNEHVGETVGYRIQLDSKVGPNTVIEVVTEGILTRRLQRDPSLEGVAVVIFDEFHERSLQADLGLALCLDCQVGLREDLRILVMSATLDVEPVAALMGDAPIIASQGRKFSVETHYLGPPVVNRFKDQFCPAVASAIKQALRVETGGILAFLPGEGEIHQVEKLLNEASLPSTVCVFSLFGALPLNQQDQAIAPAVSGQRKIVLASAIAETSLTIEGVRVVVDGGLMRLPRFDPASGMTRLITEPVSLAAAAQRQGRAGRLEPGICYRLWDKAAEGAYKKFNQPEILDADLAPLALDLASWGIHDPQTLRWLSIPPRALLAQGQNLLELLGALDDQGRITTHGRSMASLPMHPRLANMVIRGAKFGWVETASNVAALLTDRDIAQRDGPGGVFVDLNLRIAALMGETTSLRTNKRALSKTKALAKEWLKRAPKQTNTGAGFKISTEEIVGALVALAYPDRIAGCRQGGDLRYRLANGRGACLSSEDSLLRSPFIAIALMSGDSRDARIWLAAPLSGATIENLFEGQIFEKETAVWDNQSQTVLARKQKCLQKLVLSDAPARTIPKVQIADALLDGIRDIGLNCLPWTKEALAWQCRVNCLYQLTGQGKNFSDDALFDTMEDWLRPYLAGKSRLAHLKSLDMLMILKSKLDWSAQQRIKRQVPSHITVPSGSRIRIDYSNPAAPILPVKLQEMFGVIETPCIIDGRLALTIHLLSPAGHPLQITQDLLAFWDNTYPDVKAKMRGRYPKHPWPHDPLSATGTPFTKNKMAKKKL
jgi:ATP-dependent helicase HrpB